MLHAARLLPSVVLLTVFTTAALALPAPMSVSELLQKSDLVALVRVLSVTCLSVSRDPKTGETLPSYSAKLELMEVIKGDEAKGDTVNAYFHAVPSGVLGPWSVFYYPGEMVWTHLTGKTGDYNTTWWNGRGEIVHKAVITELPTTPGETSELVNVAAASHAKEGSISIEQPWSRATPGGAQVAVGYLTIKNEGTTEDRLVSVTAEIAGRAEIHQMSMADDVMKMRHVTDGLPVPANGSVVLDPNSYHLMFMELKRQLREGEHFSGTLTFEKAGTVDVMFDVEGVGATGPKPKRDHQ